MAELILPPDRFAELAVATIFLVTVGGSMLLGYRGRLRSALRQGLAWLIVFVAVAAGYGIWDDLRRAPVAVESSPGKLVARIGPDGHFHLPLSINGIRITAMLDTGASDLVLSREDAARIGLDSRRLTYTDGAMTANGSVETARIRLDRVELGPFTDRNVSAYVADSQMPGSLIGMRYLGRFARIEITGDQLVLER